VSSSGLVSEFWTFLHEHPESFKVSRFSAPVNNTHTHFCLNKWATRQMKSCILKLGPIGMIKAIYRIHPSSISSVSHESRWIPLFFLRKKIQTTEKAASGWTGWASHPHRRRSGHFLIDTLLGLEIVEPLLLAEGVPSVLQEKISILLK
jgi:hypothetical protein